MKQQKHSDKINRDDATQSVGRMRQQQDGRKVDRRTRGRTFEIRCWALWSEIEKSACVS